MFEVSNLIRRGDGTRMFKVGNLIRRADGSRYLGVILLISKEKNVIVHQCLTTFKLYKKSFLGFHSRFYVYESR